LQECYAWAADGQCQLNAGHMLTQCKYSCWEWYNYRSKAKKYEGAEIDRSMDCHGWANQGECGKNPVRAAHQLRMCTALALLHDACALCPLTRHMVSRSGDATTATLLPDRRARCPSLPQTFMKDKCPQSCKDKGYDPPPPPPSEGKKKKRKKKKKAGAAVKDEV
jgi:hypothetical protein